MDKKKTKVELKEDSAYELNTAPKISHLKKMLDKKSTLRASIIINEILKPLESIDNQRF